MKKDAAATDARTGSSGMTWALGVLAIFFVYVASWPPVELAFGTKAVVMGSTGPLHSSIEGGTVFHSTILFERSGWVQVVYAPRLALEFVNEGRNPALLVPCVVHAGLACAPVVGGEE